jgi:hypothetical protein
MIRLSGSMKLLTPIHPIYLRRKSDRLLTPKADVWLRKNTRGKKTVLAALRLLNGTTVITDLELDGRSFRDVLKGTAE